MTDLRALAEARDYLALVDQGQPDHMKQPYDRHIAFLLNRIAALETAAKALTAYLDDEHITYWDPVNEMSCASVEACDRLETLGDALRAALGAP